MMENCFRNVQNTIKNVYDIIISHIYHKIKAEMQLQWIFLQYDMYTLINIGTLDSARPSTRVSKITKKRVNKNCSNVLLEGSCNPLPLIGYSTWCEQINLRWEGRA